MLASSGFLYFRPAPLYKSVAAVGFAGIVLGLGLLQYRRRWVRAEAIHGASIRDYAYVRSLLSPDDRSKLDSTPGPKLKKPNATVLAPYVVLCIVCLVAAFILLPHGHNKLKGIKNYPAPMTPTKSVESTPIFTTSETPSPSPSTEPTAPEVTTSSFQQRTTVTSQYQPVPAYTPPSQAQTTDLQYQGGVTSTPGNEPGGADERTPTPPVGVANASPTVAEP
ncbi:hypothetical protein [Corynebacterium sp. H130]|uniref:hypothetical protein n=1 Tax=Corynebacterium sp. H130 TaxID=3133444 RepID=UPI0030B0D4AA